MVEAESRDAHYTRILRLHTAVKKVKEADLYSAFIEVPYTQGAQVRITQCYLQITPYLPYTCVIVLIVISTITH